MKKLFFVISICALFAAAPLFAQDEGEAKGFYYVNVPIARIYPYAKGYVISYNTGILGHGLDTVYIPQEWFKPGEERKGEVVNISGVKIPSFTVVYKDGAFDHVKLYVRKDRRDPSWGYMPLQTNLDDKFENVTDIPLKF